MRAAGVWSIAALTVSCAVAACSAPPTTPPPVPPPVPPTWASAPEHLNWQAVTLPDGVRPITAVEVDSRLVVGGYAPKATNRPRLTLLDGGRVVREIPVRPDASSPYAPLAQWVGLAWDGRQLTGVGGAPGGAHANTRYTTWEGDLTEVRETPQSFYAFGGYGAGGLIGVAATRSGPIIAGAWDGVAGLDAAVWAQAAGRKWVRRDSARTALASTGTDLVGVSGATGAPGADGSRAGMLLTGSVTQLRSGSVRRFAAVWRSADGRGFTRLDLPESGSASEAVGADCDTSGCVVAGRVDERLALWWVPLSGNPTRVGGLPDLMAPVATPVPAPAISGERLVCGVGATVLVRSSGTWQRVATPAGTVRELHVQGRQLTVISGDTPESARISLGEVR